MCACSYTDDSSLCGGVVYKYVSLSGAGCIVGKAILMWEGCVHVFMYCSEVLCTSDWGCVGVTL